MKSIVLDLKDISDSREMYQSKPHPFTWIFTYLLLTIIAAALIWSIFGKIEIVVKANGQVRSEAGISTVRNIYAGEIQEVNFKQGQAVKKGDVLFSINHDSLVVERDSLQQQLDAYNNELNNLIKYRDSIDSHTNEFDPAADAVYYQKVNKFLLDLDAALDDADIQKTKVQEEMQVNKDKLTCLNKEIVHIKEYIESLDSGKNKVSQEDDSGIRYSQRFEEYLINRNDLNRQYDQQILQIKSNNYESLQLSLDNDKALLEAYTTLKNSIEAGKDLFSNDDQYAGLYYDYLLKLSQLQSAIDQSESIYNAYLALKGLGVSDAEITSARGQMEKAQGDLESYKIGFISSINKNIQDLQVNIKDLESRLNGSLDQDTLLKLNEDDRNNALSKLYLNERQTMYDTEENTQDNIDSLKLNISLSEVQLKSMDTNNSEDSNSSYITVERLKAQELVAADDNIKTVSDNIKTLQQNIKKTDLDIQNAIVTANIDGVANVIKDIYPGDFLSSGEEILTIIPKNNTAYLMQVYVSNKDIGELKAGDSVKYNFAALPSKEYGEMMGTITNISEDALSSQSSGESYYIVEATVPETKLFSHDGKQGDIKVGMICEANIITKQESVIRFLLEKIDLLD